MRFLFIVQGEGRGHMTQAISLASLLRKGGHQVHRVIVGKSERRTIPDFFLEGIGARVDQVDSPNFVTDKDNKSVNLTKSIIHALRKFRIYRKSINVIDQIVREERPDVVINFFDFICGIYYYLKRPDVRFVCIAHQYLAGHSSFRFPEGRWLEKQTMKWGNWLTSLGADQRLALSFCELPDESGIEVVPPLLRKELVERKVTNEDCLLVYMLNHGYAEEIRDFHKKHPHVKLHCFWDKPGEPSLLPIDETLTFHQLNGTLFLDFMAKCKGFLTTAGFESVCEAMYLGKPVMMMPVHGHYEQACNALEAEAVGAGIKSDRFDLEVLLNYLPQHQSITVQFQGWCDRSAGIFLEKLTGSLNNR